MPSDTSERRAAKPTRSQLIALEDTERHGNPSARVFGSAAHGGFSGTMAVLNRNKWVLWDEKSRRWWLTDAGRKALRESD
jgi:hypothetical protein